MFPRSAIKALQALPLVETGAADRYGFGAEELALACASHSAEPAHADDRGADAVARRARSWGAAVRRALADPPAVGAGAGARGRPGQRAAQQLLRQARRFLCAACATGADVAAYIEPSHPVQREVRATLESLTGVTLGDPRSTAARRRPGRSRSARWRAASHASRPARDFARARQGRGAAARRLHGEAVACRRHRTVLHRVHDRVRRAGVRQDRR